MTPLTWNTCRLVPATTVAGVCVSARSHDTVKTRSQPTVTDRNKNRNIAYQIASALFFGKCQRKLQYPGSNLQRISKHQCPNSKSVSGSVMLEVSLVLGAWSLELGASPVLGGWMFGLGCLFFAS